MPTLLEAGKIELPKHLSALEAARINQMLAKEYILERFGSRVKSVYEKANTITCWVDRILILMAGTGSGKSVTIGPEIYLKYKEQLKRTIVNTQPRVASAISTVTNDIIKIYPLKLGTDVGYQTRAITNKPPSGLLFASIGIVNQQSKIMDAEAFMNKYSVIIIDEAHERSIETDSVLLFLKKFLKKHWENPRCPLVIIMSATLDIDLFSSYFSDKVNGRSITPEVIKVAGKTYPIVEHFLKHPTDNYISTIISTVEQIHTENEDDFDEKFKDILIFMPGEKQIDKVYTMLLDANNNFKHKLYPIRMTSTIINRGGEDKRAFDLDIETLKIEGESVSRKVIIATNVIETSFTIKTLKYVIDSGFRNRVEFVSYGNSFMLCPITKDMALQRKGRAGRDAPGHWYPMYTEKTFELLDATKLPDIVTSDVTMCILSNIVLNDVFDDANIDYMNNIHNDSLLYAMERLFIHNAITVHNKSIVPTALGIILNKFRNININWVMTLLSGYHYRADILSLITMVALAKSKIFTYSYKLRETSIQIGDTFIDKILLFEEFKKAMGLMSFAKLIDWCEKNEIKYHEMIFAIKERDDCISDLITCIGYDPLYNGLGLPVYNLLEISEKMPDVFYDEVVKLKKCIYNGFKNVAVLEDLTYVTLTGNLPIVLKHQIPKQSRLIVYDEITIMRDKKGNFVNNIENYSYIDGYFTPDLSEIN